MRVLLMAEDCNPEWPSLPSVGFQMVRALAQIAQVTLATHVRNRHQLEGKLANMRVVYLDNEYVAKPLFALSKLLRGGTSANWSTAVAMAYPGALAFDREVIKHFKAELREGVFDVVHRLTPMSPALPSPMSSFSPTPFVLGPLNGGLPWPSQYLAEKYREKEQLHTFRLAYKWMPYHRSTYRNAAAILASFEHTLADLPDSARARCFDYPEVGVDPQVFYSSGERPDNRRLTFICVGRLVPLKLLDVALRVFAGSEQLRRHKLVLVGDGMERHALETQARELGLQQVVEFTGWISADQVAERLRAADIFFFPSIRELGGGVVVEAMSCGCVPVVVDYGGPGGVVAGQSCGAAVPLGDKGELVKRFTNVLENYVRDRSLRLEHAAAAVRRAQAHFSWNAKASKLVEIYQWVLGQRSLRPRCGANNLIERQSSR